MKVAAIQQRCVGEVVANLKGAFALIEEAADLGARLVVLPELFAYLFFPKGWDHAAFELAQPVDGDIVTRCRNVASARSIWLVVPFFERDLYQDRYFNSLVLLDPRGALVGIYRKLHVPLTSTNYERRYFSPGNLGVLVHDVEGLRVGFGICYDRHFPELARACVSRGAQLLVYPSSSLRTPERDGVGNRCPAWEATFVTRAVDNAAYVLTASRAGVEDDVPYIGRSLAVDPAGAICGTLADEEAAVLVIDVDTQAVDMRRKAWRVLEETRPHLLEEILQSLPGRLPRS